MNILAIDTSTEACSAALLRADGAIFSEFEIAPRQHVQLLPVMMDAVLAASEIPRQSISHCAFTNGPGAFTGIRIATAQAQGIGLALDIPLLPVSTLAVLAQTCMDHFECDNALVALDARMQEIYWASYHRDVAGRARLTGSERLGSVNEIEIAANIECGGGHGWFDELRTRVSFPVDDSLLPNAKALLKLATAAIEQNLGMDASKVSINYLRNQVAEKATS
jgi:tRNA threonylcarbamoyladenosine biosynthesis protein TsaB